MAYKDRAAQRASEQRYRDRHREVLRERQREYMREWRKTPAGEAWEKKLAEQKRAKRAADPEKYKEASRKNKLMRRYGMSLADYDAMYAAQNGTCASCSRPESERPLHIDHDHATGQVRALLCVNCNQALGHLAEDPERIMALAEYARRWRP